jgi:threonine dehydrogenase-like Zn-dependent dehydrogenase
MGGPMTAIVWDGKPYPDGLSFRDFEVPEPGPGWVLVYNKASGICGSDLHYLSGRGRDLIPDQNLPAVLGHENAGIVIRPGPGVTGLQPGQRVAAEPLHGCMQFGGSCSLCRVGKYNICRSGKVHVGIPMVRMLPGGYGEYSIVHETRLFPIPERISFEEAALLDVLAVSVHAMQIGRPRIGETAVVYGCGVLGLDTIQCLRAVGIGEIVAVAKYEFQAEAARRLGAREVILSQDGTDPSEAIRQLTDGSGVDQVYECVGGETDAIAQAIAMCGRGGRVVMMGAFPSGPRPVSLRTMLTNEISLLACNSYATAGTVREYQIALDMLIQGQADHMSLITHRYAPEDYQTALDVTMNKAAHASIKTVFVRQ